MTIGKEMKKIWVTTLAVVIYLLAFASFADVSASDIYISDPLSSYIKLGEANYLAANIKNFEPNTKLYLSITQLFSTIVDEEVYKAELPVSKLRLIAPSYSPASRFVEFSVSSGTEEEEAKPNYVEIVEKYFLLKEKEEGSVQSAPVKSFDDDDLYDYRYWKTKYQQLFEKQVFLDIITSPSYYTALSGLEQGIFLIRFLNEEGFVIKETVLEVVKPSEIPLQPVFPVSGVK